MNTTTLTSGTIDIRGFEATGNSYVLEGQSPSNPPALSFISFSFSNLGSVAVVGSPASPTHPYFTPAYGEILQHPFSFLEISNGVQLDAGTLTIQQTGADLLVLDGQSRIFGVMDVEGHDLSAMILNGTIDLTSIGNNSLNLEHEWLAGHGAIFQEGEGDRTTVGPVAPGTRFQIASGTLAIQDPLSFGGTIGPLAGPTSVALGIFGEIAIYNAFDTSRANFDTSDDLLSLLNSDGQVLGRLHFAGDVSGIHVNKLSDPGYDFIAIGYSGNAGVGVGGNIPVTVVGTPA